MNQKHGVNMHARSLVNLEYEVVSVIPIAKATQEYSALVPGIMHVEVPYAVPFYKRAVQPEMVSLVLTDVKTIYSSTLLHP